MFIAKTSACANVKPKVVPNKTIFPNSISAVLVKPTSPPTKINSNTNTATKAPIGSIRIPSHLRTVETSLFKGIFLKIGVITVGPVTIINPENKKHKSQVRLNKQCAITAPPKKVTAAPSVISFEITGPTFRISLRFKVSPPSNKIILIASETK